VTNDSALTPATLHRRFTSSVHDERTAAVLGIALGVTFTVCFATGLWSHIQQHPQSWYIARPRPAGLYRVTQGVHVATGLASIPLLLAKLWTVYPKLFAWPPFTSAAMLLERLALIPLVGGALFMLFTGLANINLWYPWPFNFPAAHYSAAWITIGALVIHVGAKLTTTRRTLRRAPPASCALDRSTSAPSSDRRVFLGTVFGGAAAVTLFTVGQTVAPLRKLALLAPRRPDAGPQGFPVNRTAQGAGVVAAAQSPDYRLVVTGKVARELHLTPDDLLAMPQHEATLPISCVEGWSASRRWTGVPVRDLVARAGGREGAAVRVESLQRRRAYRTSMLTRHETADRDTLLALAVDGAPLHLDHGYPARLIGPNRPGVLQTKWVTRLVVR
jgi:DMSO/TMAO reductase YedYZ molybdopterin-dependent catalytic subunit